MNVTGSKTRVTQIYIILTLGSFVSFFPLLRNDFINYDDDAHVTANPHVRTGLTAENIKWAFTTGHAANWQPLTWLSHMVDCQLFDLNPFFHHLTSLLLHMANALILFTILNAMTGAIWRSAFVAAAFAIHPLHVESVAWVAERKDVLSNMFLLLAIGCYLRYVKRKTALYYLLILLLFASGLLAKPMAVTFPFVLLLLDYWPLNRLDNLSLTSSSTRRTIYSLVWEKIPFFMLSAISCVITFLVQQRAGAVMDIHRLPLSVRFANSLISYVRYIEKLFVPTKLAIIYPFVGGPPPFYLAMLAGLAILTVTVLVIWFAPKRRYLFTGWMWYLGTLVPVIGLVQVGIQTFADRYTYIPLTGLFIIIAWGLNDLLISNPSRKKLLTLSASAALLALAVCTVFQVRYWRNSLTLFEHATAVTAKNYVAHTNLGLALMAQGEYEQAVGHYCKAIEINPRYTAAITNLGCAYNKLGYHHKALELHKRALQIKPDLAAAYYNLASTYGQLDKHTEAMEAYKKALTLNCEYAEAHFGLGVACGRCGLYEQSAEEFRKTIKINPEYFQAYESLGFTLGRLNLWTQTLEVFKRAVEIQPDCAKAWHNLGVAYGQLGQHQDAIDAFKHALRIEPDYPDAYYAVGIASKILGRHSDAIQAFQQAINFRPDYLLAHYNLALAYFGAGDKDKAMRQYEILKNYDPNLAQNLLNSFQK